LPDQSHEFLYEIRGQNSFVIKAVMHQSSYDTYALYLHSTTSFSGGPTLARVGHYVSFSSVIAEDKNSIGLEIKDHEVFLAVHQYFFISAFLISPSFI